MKLSTSLVLAAALAGGIAIAADMNTAPMGNMGGMGGMMNMMRSMQGMDANGDRLLSKGEFMASHEAMFDAMKKNRDGMVEMTGLPCM